MIGLSNGHVARRQPIRFKGEKIINYLVLWKSNRYSSVVISGKKRCLIHVIVNDQLITLKKWNAFTGDILKDFTIKS